jgi:hypothetical protein
MDLPATGETRVVIWPALAVLALAVLPGCAAIPLAGIGASALESGAGEVVKVGTEYTTGGTVRRTFTIPAVDVRRAVLQAFSRTGVQMMEDNEKKNGQEIIGELRHRTVRVHLLALSPSLTELSMVVKRNLLSKDRATTSELLEQVEQVLAENPKFARLLHRAVNGVEPAASPSSR